MFVLVNKLQTKKLSLHSCYDDMTMDIYGMQTMKYNIQWPVIVGKLDYIY